MIMIMVVVMMIPCKDFLIFAFSVFKSVAPNDGDNDSVSDNDNDHQSR